MPNEVFDLWITPNIPAYGWPFSSATQSVEGTLREAYFAERSLEWWAAASWSRQSFGSDQISFCPISMQRATWILDSVVRGWYSPTWNIHNTHERFWRCMSYIERHGKLPAPLICVSMPEGMDVVDGHHRLAALLHQRVCSEISIEIWTAACDSVQEKPEL